MMRRPDNCGYLLAIIATFVTFLVAVLCSVISAIGGDVVFPADTVRAYYAFHVTFDIPPWMHFILFPIGFWQFSWLVYGMSTLCRRRPDAEVAMYCEAGCIPIAIYSMFSMSLITYIFHLVALSQGYLGMAFGFALLLATTLFLCLYIIAKNIAKHAPDLIRVGRGSEVALLRGLLLNGIGMFSGYADYYVFSMFGKLLVYYGGLDQAIAGSVTLILWTILYLSAFALDFTKWDKLARHLLTPYIVQAFLACGIMTHLVDWTSFGAIDYVKIFIFLIHLALVLARVIETIKRDKKESARNKGISPGNQTINQGGIHSMFIANPKMY